MGRIPTGFKVAIVVVAALFLLALAAECSGRLKPHAAAPGNRPEYSQALANPGFEEGWTRQTTYWTAGGGPYHDEYGEIFVPASWIAWWMEGQPCSAAYTFVAGRPEMGLINPAVDAWRVRSGNQAFKAFTFWRCHLAGLYQRVRVTPGYRYQAWAYGHAWYSSCDQYPHGQPLEGDCATPLTWAHDWLNVGIDPNGGDDPRASSVRWGAAREVYGQYGPPLLSPAVTAQGEWLTVFLRSDADNPLKHSDAYWDDAALVRVDWQVFLPVVIR